ncbi:MAG: DinB family protein [Marmoricola sp.]|nr:DinB family protein [Marmoricola sp.]
MDDNPTDLAEILLIYLQRERDHLVATLDGLDEYDVRRPMTPTGTSLLGLVKHVASVELGYFNDCVGRETGLDLPWDDEQAMNEALDMYALHDESREWLLDVYRRSWALADANVRELGLDAPAEVPWWPPERRRTTLGRLLVHMLDETAHHAGHADVVRESIDGRGGRDHDDFGDEARWQEFVGRIQAEADHFQG